MTMEALVVYKNSSYLGLAKKVSWFSQLLQFFQMN